MDTEEKSNNLDQGNEVNCDTCERFGDDLPVRIGIGLKGKAIECPQKLTQGYPQLPDFLVYTLRILETGYLYIYGDGWIHDHFKQGLEAPLRAYTVSKNGSLTAIGLASVEEHEDVEQTHLQCFESQEGVQSKKYSDITAKALILDTYMTGSEFGIVYSRHQFSKDIIEKKASIDKSIFLNVSTASSADKRRLPKSQIDLIDDLKNNNFEEAYAWIKDRDITNTNSFFKNRTNTLASLGEYFEGESRRNYPIIVLDDPVGLLKDIGQIMRYLKEKYNIDNEKNLFMDAKFSEIQYGVYRSSEAGAYIEIEDYMKRGIIANYKKGLLPNEMIYGLQGEKFKIKISEYSKKELKEILDNEDFDILDILTEESKTIFVNEVKTKRDERFKEDWGGYLEVINKEKFNNWIVSAPYKQLENKLDLLSNLYITFYESDMLYHYMDNYFDKKRLESQGEYFNILNVIIGDSVIFSRISEFYYNQLKEKNISDRNYCLKALCYNNEKLIKYIEDNKINVKIENTFDFLFSASEKIPQNSGVYFGYSQVIDEFDAITLLRLKASPSHAVISEKLHAQLALIFNEAGSDLRNYPVAFGIQVFNEQKFIKISWVGPVGRMKPEIIKTLESSGYSAEKHSKKRQAGLQSKLDRIGIEENLKDPHKIIKFEAIVDKELYQTTQERKVVKRASQSIFDYKIEKDFMNSQVLKFQPNNNRALALGILGTALQCMAIANAYEALFNESVSLEKHLDAQAQFVGQPLILIGSIMDYVQRQLQTYRTIPNVTNKAFGITISRFDSVRNLARIGLYGGATIFAILEFKNAWVSFNRNNKTSMVFDSAFGFSLIGSTYLLRKGTTYMSARLLGLGATGWGIILIFVGFGLDYYADYNRRQQIKNWLKASYWGISDESLSINQSEKNYKLALREVMGTDYDWANNE